MSNDNDKAKLPAQTLLQSGKNYSAWATRLRNKFEKEDVWEVVRPIAEGGQVAPAAAAAAATRKKWRTDNATAKEIMFKLLDDSMTNLYGHHDEARAIWETLRAEFLREGETDQCNARTELGKLKHKYNADISELLRDLERLFLVFTQGNNPRPLTNGERIGYAISILRATGGRWRQVADVHDGIAALQPPGAVMRWDDFKAKLQREQRDRDAHVGGWANDFNQTSTFKNKFSGPTSRAYAAAIEAGCTPEQAIAVANAADDQGGDRSDGSHGGNVNATVTTICHNCSKRGHMLNVCRSKQWCSECSTSDHPFGLCPKNPCEISPTICTRR